MNTKTYSFLAALMLMLSTSGCFFFKNKCEDLDCGSGNCIDGECECFAGYTGDNCQEAFSERWLGDFAMVSNICDSSVIPAYELSVVEGGNGLVINLIGLHDFADYTGQTNVNIDEDDPNQFTINRRIFYYSNGGYEVFGSGTLSADGETINIEYKIWDQNDNRWEDHCRAEFSRI